MRRGDAARFAFNPTWLGGVVVLGAIAAAIWVFGLVGDEARGALEYRRTAVQAGEGYRILSAHFVHLNRDHLVWNLLGLLVSAFALLDVLEARGLTLACVVSSLCVGIGLLWFSPNLHVYVGLSGVTHGLFLWGGLSLVQVGRPYYGGLVLVVLGAKVVWEQFAGPMPGAEELIDGRVVVDVHLYGAVGGGLAWVLRWAGARARRLVSVAVAAVVVSGVMFAPDAAEAHRATAMEVRIGVAEDDAVVLVIETHLASFSLRRPFGPFDRDSRDFLAGLSDADLRDYVDGAAAFLSSRARLGDSETRIAPVGIHYPTPDQVRAEGLRHHATAPPEPIYLIFEPGDISPERAVRLDLPALLGSYRLSVHPRTGPAFVQFVDAGEDSEPFVIDVPMPWYRRATDYLVQGIRHVVPHGLDHSLFIATLALALPHIGPLVVQATVFTLAHSLTLALAVLGIIAGPATLVETGIAVSIAVMGISNVVTLLRGRSIVLSRWRLAVIFLFGLLHGMGFASVFADLDLATENLALTLASFNIGVEIGQIIVLLLVLLAVWVADRSAPERKISGGALVDRLRLSGSALIACFGLFWVIERVGASF